MHNLRRRLAAPLFATFSGDAEVAPVSGSGNQLYRISLLALTFLGFLAQLLNLSTRKLPGAGSLWSNLLQLVLGVLAVLAMLEARKRSSRFGRRVWFLTALGVAVYTAGQAIYTWYEIALHFTFSYSPWISDPIFFFWMVPLIAAAASNSEEMVRGMDWSSILDFLLLVILATAVQFSVFGDASRWQADPEAMGFLKWKVRLFRDLVVLACLWGRVVVSDSNQVRALFRRIGTFYLAYALADATYLYREASHHGPSGTWFDLLWSVPRIVAVVVALTWDWREEIEVRPASSIPSLNLLHYWVPLVVPLAILALSARLFSSAPALGAGLMVATFAIVGLRLRIAQSRQRRAATRLHSSNSLLHAIIEGTSEAVYLKDAHGRYMLMNPAGARLLGSTPEEIIGKTDRELFTPDEAEAIAKSDREAIESGQVVTAEDILTSAGSSRTYLTTKNPYCDPQGRVIGVLGISVDVTEHRRMEEQLQRAQRMESLGTFSGGIAHDFNNLITIIKGYSYLAHADAEGHPAVRDSLEQIRKAAGRASALVDQLLAFSRKQVLQLKVVSVNDIVGNVGKMLERVIGEDVQIETRLAPKLGAVRADPGQIEQVLLNLAANARDAMPGGGKLTMETADVALNGSKVGRDLNVPPGSYAVVTVSDTGVGMDEQTLARIFEPFFTTKPPGKGTGLGLAMAYGIVKQSGGYICVDSKPGLGTTFRIYLPRVNEPVEVLSHTAPMVAPQRGDQTILLVDDDSQLRELASRVLNASGYNVLEADDGEQAERLAAGHSGSIHLLLTDVVLPGHSGRETAERICRERGETRVLYMSGYPGETIAHHGILEAGISFLQKPFFPDRLVGKVREVLNGC
jgi:PAS domain S-box-containing protein